MKKQPITHKIDSQFGSYIFTINIGTDIHLEKGTETNMFKIGDMAEYGSYNLSYYGPIVAIGQKTVTIKELNSSATHRLSLAKFGWRNINFNHQKAEKYNSEEMYFL